MEVPPEYGQGSRGCFYCQAGAAGAAGGPRLTAVHRSLSISLAAEVEAGRGVLARRLWWAALLQQRACGLADVEEAVGWEVVRLKTALRETPEQQKDSDQEEEAVGVEGRW